MAPSTNQPTRSSWQRAAFNGLKCRCPNCGRGKLYARYLEPVEHCDVCGEAYGDRYQVGLLLPFIVVTVLGHILVFALLEAARLRINPLLSLAIFIPIVLVVSLLLLPPVKGALIGILWFSQLSDEQR
ncbi:ZINC-FINGER PROTEIN [Devosia sp. DBB001]|nr:ZINC-FINGER PROTEIN [Devosia sp. DBB001]